MLQTQILNSSCYIIVAKSTPSATCMETYWQIYSIMVVSFNMSCTSAACCFAMPGKIQKGIKMLRILGSFFTLFPAIHALAPSSLGVSAVASSFGALSTKASGRRGILSFRHGLANPSRTNAEITPLTFFGSVAQWKHISSSPA